MTSTTPQNNRLKRRKIAPQPELVERVGATLNSEDKNPSVKEVKTPSVQGDGIVTEAKAPLNPDYVIAQKPFLLRMPKPLKDELISVLDRMPGRLSMQKFILKLVQDEVARLKKELDDK